MLRHMLRIIHWFVLSELDGPLMEFLLIRTLYLQVLWGFSTEVGLNMILLGGFVGIIC